MTRQRNADEYSRTHNKTTYEHTPIQLNIHAARYGWAVDIWNADCGSGYDQGGGAKDVTSIVQQLVVNDELHINPNKQGQYMNRTFWPETAHGPAIPRKVLALASSRLDELVVD